MRTLLHNWIKLITLCIRMYIGIDVIVDWGKQLPNRYWFYLSNNIEDVQFLLTNFFCYYSNVVIYKPNNISLPWKKIYFSLSADFSQLAVRWHIQYLSQTVSPRNEMSSTTYTTVASIYICIFHLNAFIVVEYYY